MFDIKLNFLMKLTKCSNKSLASAISLDASYVSRLRRGVRKLPDNAPFVTTMSSYLVSRLSKNPDSIRRIGPLLDFEADSAPEEDDLESLVADWLVSDTPIPDKAFPVSGLSQGESPSPLRKSETRFFNGHSGKLDALLFAASRLIRHEGPKEILYFSSEHMDWLFGDPGLNPQITHLLSWLTRQNYQLKVINPMARTVEDLRFCVVSWHQISNYFEAPIYSFSNWRDDVVNISYIICRDRLALFSTSVGTDPDTVVTTYTEDPKVVKALETQYNLIFNNTRALIDIVPFSDQPRMDTIHTTFHEAGEGFFSRSYSLPFITLRSDLLHAFQKNHSDLILNEQQKAALTDLEEILKTEPVYCVFSLPPLVAVLDGSAYMPIPYHNNKVIYYRPEEFLLHLDYIISINEQYDNFYLIVSPKDLDASTLLLKKHHSGLHIIHKENVNHLYHICDRMLADAFWHEEWEDHDFHSPLIQFLNHNKLKDYRESLVKAMHSRDDNNKNSLPNGS